jgi:DNA-binding NtrC family response regulator
MEKKSILIVDDDKSLLTSLAQILTNEGYQVDTADTGQKAVEKSKAQFYHLVLLDIKLPDMEGTQLLTAMKDTTPKMVKIIITGYPSLDNAVEAVNKNADGYVIKPIDMNKLLETVKKHLKQQDETRTYSEEKVKEFIETRAKEIGSL